MIVPANSRPVEQQDGRGMLDLCPHRVRHRLGVNSILLFHLVDLRRRAGEADDRRVEQPGILADFLGPVVLRIDGDEDDVERVARRPLAGAASPAATSVVGHTSPQRVKPK